MLNGINLEEVKQYNTSLKQYKDQAANLKAEIEYTNKALDEMCGELSKELGLEVNRDNLEQIYNDQVNKIQTALQSGKAVLSKIKSEEQSLAQSTNNTDVNIPTQPVNNMGMNNQQFTKPLFNGQESTLDNSNVSALPPLFSI